MDNKPQRLNLLIDTLIKEFKVVKSEPLELITIRHYNTETITPLIKGKMVLFEERIRNTAQFVVKEIPVVERIEA